MKPLALRSFRLRNFKAVRDSGVIRFRPLTVFIGNNGSGKSSILESLECFQAIVERGLDAAMQAWRGFEHVWHRGVLHNLRASGEDRPHHTSPMAFELAGRASFGSFRAAMAINVGKGGNELFIQREELTFSKSDVLRRDSSGNARREDGDGKPLQVLARTPDGTSCLEGWLKEYTADWQFLALVPQAMGSPVPQKRTGGFIRLAKDGSNIAEYLLEIRNLDPAAFDGIFETLRHVLPYARDLQPDLTSELERTAYLQLTEGEFKVPGWLLSTGTLRILALLALFRHPHPPSLIAIEEIENGLDPRTIHLLVDEMQNVVDAGRNQILLTTHSPYLLDLLPLSSLVLVDRMEGAPVFSRPADRKDLAEWAKQFNPGKLYTMGRLTRKGGR
jgi:predicted ATPase